MRYFEPAVSWGGGVGTQTGGAPCFLRFWLARRCSSAAALRTSLARRLFLSAPKLVLARNAFHHDVILWVDTDLACGRTALRATRCFNHDFIYPKANSSPMGELRLPSMSNLPTGGFGFKRGCRVQNSVTPIVTPSVFQGLFLGKIASKLLIIGERGGTRTLDPMIKSHVPT